MAPITARMVSASAMPGIVPYTSPSRCYVSAFWMQTTGAALLAVKRCSLRRLWLPAQDGHSAYGLLYLAAVRNDRSQRGCLQVGLDLDSELCHGSSIVHFKPVQRVTQPTGSFLTISTGSLRLASARTLSVPKSVRLDLGQLNQCSPVQPIAAHHLIRRVIPAHRLPAHMSVDLVERRSSLRTGNAERRCAAKKVASAAHCPGSSGGSASVERWLTLPPRSRPVGRV
jgi:hypothetical protein